MEIGEILDQIGAGIYTDVSGEMQLRYNSRKRTSMVADTLRSDYK